MRKTDDFAVVECLRGVFTDCSAAFEEQDFFAFAGKLDGERDAGGSRSDDADVCEEVRAGGVVKEIVESRATCEAGFAARAGVSCDSTGWTGSARG